MAASIQWLAPLVERMRGVKLPRYPALWDACANAIVFQQVSLRAASTIMHRVILAVGRSLETGGVRVPLYLVPGCGKRAGCAGRCPASDWAQREQGRDVTARVILLRGLGRLDVFPANDTSVASNMALVAGVASIDAPRVLDVLGSQRGMLYFYLLLARLEARGELGRPSFERPRSVVHHAGDSNR